MPRSTDRRRRCRNNLRKLLVRLFANEPWKKPRKGTKHAAYTNHECEDGARAKRLRRPGAKDPGSKDGKLFRRRFRVPCLR